MLSCLHTQLQFDGAWIDMNEPSNFLSGSFNGCPKSSIESPPYMPAVDGGVLNYKTMCMSALHYAGSHYDIHNLFGFAEAIVTSLYVRYDVHVETNLLVIYLQCYGRNKR